MSSELVKYAAQIVDAYVSNNELSAREVPALLQSIYNSLVGLEGKVAPAAPAPAPEAVAPVEVAAAEAAPAPKKPAAKAAAPTMGEITPAVPIKDAVQQDQVFCLLCGKGCKALKGHLTRTHKIELRDYLQTFDLPKDFPMVAPSYAAQRRKLAIDSGLGEKLTTARKKRRTLTRKTATL